MKKAFLLGTLIVVLFSCQQTYQKVKERTDTVVVSGRNTDDNLFTDSAIRVIQQMKKEKDSGSMELVWKMDTAYYPAQLIDTMRDSKGKPVYDSVRKGWRMRFAFAPLPIPDSLVKYVKVISDLPYHHLKH